MPTIDTLTAHRPSPLWRIPVLLVAAVAMIGGWVAGAVAEEREATAPLRRAARARLDRLAPALRAAAARPLTAPLKLPDECRRYGDLAPRWRGEDIAEDRIERLVEGGVRGVIVVRWDDPGTAGAKEAVRVLGARIIAPLPGAMVGSGYVFCVPDNADGQGLDRALAHFAGDPAVWDAYRRIPEGVLTDSTGRSLDELPVVDGAAGDSTAR